MGPLIIPLNFKGKQKLQQQQKEDKVIQITIKIKSKDKRTKIILTKKMTLTSQSYR